VADRSWKALSGEDEKKIFVKTEIEKLSTARLDLEPGGESTNSYHYTRSGKKEEYKGSGDETYGPLKHEEITRKDRGGGQRHPHQTF